MAEQGRLRWNVERRLAFIELRLFWEGRINRSDLMDFFGVSQPQASQDLTRYDRLAPGNLAYDKTARTYVTGPDFLPRLIAPSADAYLAQLRALATGGLAPGDSWIGRPPAFAGTPRVRRTYDLETLRRLVRAIQGRLTVRVRYLSFSEDAPTTRLLSPHALGFDGQRWHLRAFCDRSRSFRDFVIGRLSHVAVSEPSPIRPEWDLEWTTEVKLKLTANPKLPTSMRQALERDHLMRDGVLEVPTTLCSAYYLESQLNLDLDPEAIPARRQQLILLNRAELETAREEARAESERLIDQGLGLSHPLA